MSRFKSRPDMHAYFVSFNRDKKKNLSPEMNAPAI